MTSTGLGLTQLGGARLGRTALGILGATLRERVATTVTQGFLKGRVRLRQGEVDLDGVPRVSRADGMSKLGVPSVSVPK